MAAEAQKTALEAQISIINDNMLKQQQPQNNAWKQIREEIRHDRNARSFKKRFHEHKKSRSNRETMGQPKVKEDTPKEYALGMDTTIDC
jgi:hypothetical protein